ncbi:DNA-(apurinic or apyrimidinic site) lyase 1 [Lachnellula cervina]|uniref:Apurinic-apyrimidinic endonuclease 1 n=1 Tax=Lachnellula cervina TaxID=1316786 RepID=A0A7D8UVQ0_9HELO|nr:DNA-(apurinic or apyrimidinic site) lyase 1 [Lachnellula cervina]
MPRRSSRKSGNEIIKTATGEATSISPRKGRKSVKVEAVEAVTKVSATKSTKKKIKKEVEVDEEEDDIKDKSVAPKISRVKSKIVVKEEIEQKPKKAPAKRKAKTEEDEDEGDADDTKAKKKRKTKEEKEAEAMPLAARTVISTLKQAMHIGAHVSAAGGVQNSLNNALHIGGNSFALFLKSQRKWTSPPLATEARDQFKAFCLEHKYDAAKHILPHGSYLVNLAQIEPDKADQAYACFLDDLQRCEALGIKLYNFHPGSTGKHPRPEAIGRIAAQLNKAHKATSTVITVLENMAGAGNVIGSTFEDLRDIIALVDDKSRLGVCLDTCHTFAAGYDLRSPEAFQKTMADFDSIVGMSYLKALHLNDSKAPLAANRDRHANIGTGFLGLRAFHNVVNFAPFQGLPMVLETPIDKKGDDGKVIEDKGVWATEIKLLEDLIGTDPETEDFKAEEQRLQDLGADEREKFQGQVDKKKQKTLDSMFKKAPPKKKAKKDINEDEDEDSDGGCNH